MMGRMRIGWMLLLICSIEALHAQDLDEYARRWAVSGSWGGNWPVVTKNTFPGKAGSSGSLHTLMLEYYLSSTRFSLKGGYVGEELTLFGGDISASLSNLEIGGRYYFLPQRFLIQPYGGIATIWNLSPRTEQGVVRASTYNALKQQEQQKYECHYRIREPLFSVAPHIGADIYVLSCLAFTIEYHFRMGVDGSMAGDIQQIHPQVSGVVRNNGMRQSFSIGLKVDFPFKLTERDGRSVLQWLDDIVSY